LTDLLDFLLVVTSGPKACLVRGFGFFAKPHHRALPNKRPRKPFGFFLSRQVRTLLEWPSRYAG
jgi:hypothetical protein